MKTFTIRFRLLYEQYKDPQEEEVKAFDADKAVYDLNIRHDFKVAWYKVVSEK